MNYMFVVAHPDDEVLGGGAFIHNVLSQGHRVRVLILNADYEKTRDNMNQDIKASHKFLGNVESKLFAFRNMEFHRENQREMVESIEQQIREFHPDVIFTHWPHDLHNDHRITSICTQQAARLWQRHSAGHKVHALMFMEVQSSSEWSAVPFKPDTYVEIKTEDIHAKFEALAAYQNVVREPPHPRNPSCIMALATVRGSEIGYNLAEAFQTCWRDSL